MSTRKLKPGDRVRVTPQSYLRDYPHRARGVIVQELAPGAVTPRYYRVGIGKGKKTSRTIILTEDEIEPDV